MQGLQLDHACCKWLPWWTLASRQGEREGTQAGKPMTQKSQSGCYSVNNNSFSPTAHSPRHSGKLTTPSVPSHCSGLRHLNWLSSRPALLSMEWGSSLLLAEVGGLQCYCFLCTCAQPGPKFLFGVQEEWAYADNQRVRREDKSFTEWWKSS